VSDVVVEKLAFQDVGLFPKTEATFNASFTDNEIQCFEETDLNATTVTYDSGDTEFVLQTSNDTVIYKFTLITGDDEPGCDLGAQNSTWIENELAEAYVIYNVTVATD